MGIIDILLKTSDAIETVGKVANFAISTTLDRIYEVHIDDMSIFDIRPSSEQAEETKGLLLKSKTMKKSFPLFYKAGTTSRYGIRLDLLTMLKNALPCRKISKKNICLKDETNYLTFEGYAKKRLGTWVITSNQKQTANYVIYKLTVFDCTDNKNEMLGYDTLYSLFVEALRSDEYQNPSYPL